MKQYGGWIARAAAAPSWNILEKSGRNWLLLRFTAILIRFGGAVTGGTLEKHGVKENFSRPVFVLRFAGPPAVSIGLYGMQFD